MEKKVTRKTTLEELIGRLGGTEWSNLGCQVAVLSMDTREMLFLKGSHSHEFAGHWLFPTGGLRRGEKRFAAVARVLWETCGFNDVFEFPGYLKFHRPRGHIGMLTPLVIAPRVFVPRLDPRDYSSFRWAAPFDDTTFDDAPMPYLIHEVFDHESSIDFLRRAMSHGPA